MIVASAGHVDHGKTTLVKQLTGVDTDRLEEEKRRGLSIDLGFAYCRGPGDQIIGFIDVPGHHRFINNMIAGVRGIDLGMLVVAADDGPMPQTIEHLDIMRLLGVTRYVVVITKIDRVEQGQVTAVRNNMQVLLADTCPVYAVNALEGSSVAGLKEFLRGRAEQIGAKPDAGYFRMSIDRSFLLKGTGLVMTGTAMSGKASVGDTLKLSPQGISLRIRTIHAQDEAVETCKAGQRCALSVVGDIRKQQVRRGDCLLDAKVAQSTSRFDAKMHLLPGSPFGLKHLSPIKLYIGAARRRAKLFLLQKPGNGNKVSPGESHLVQLIVEGEIACCSGDRFLLRDDSESVTLGGGIVLDAHAPRITRPGSSRLKFLQAMEIDTVAGKLQALLIDRKQVLDLERFKRSWNLRDEEFNQVLLESGLTEKIKLFNGNETDFAVAAQEWSAAVRSFSNTLMNLHKEKPGEAGIPLKELKARCLTGMAPEILTAVMAEQQKCGALKTSRGLVSASDHQAALSSEAERQWSAIQRALEKHGTDIPVLSNLQKTLEYDEMTVARAIRDAEKCGKVICLTKGRYVLPGVLRTLAESTGELAGNTPQFSVKEFKNHTGLSRNLCVEVLEYFDSIRFTARSVDKRSVIDASAPAKYF